jgi:hypothetical protein
MFMNKYVLETRLLLHIQNTYIRTQFEYPS